jgi:hypothetical protein
MSFLKRLFGSKQEEPYVDRHGLYFYVQCDHCGSQVRVRADKQHDLNHHNGGYVWHKTIVDSRCFRPIRTVVYLDGNYQMVDHEIEGGRYISREEFEAGQAADAPQTTGDEPQPPTS